jgi:hypothetical protein
MNKKRKLLTLDDLVQFCKKQKFYEFHAKDDGDKLSVQIPAIATYDESEQTEDPTLLFCKVKMFHTGKNRNGSNVLVDAAQKALPTIAYKPLLANFCEIDDVKDFTSHDVEIKDDNSVVYLEQQIGTFTENSAYMDEEDDENGRRYIYATVAIPREYTDAAEIIERKNGTKVSVEILVNAMSYDKDNEVLNLEDIVVQGCTCLGKDPETGKDVEEGMEGARLDIADFSVHNNSICYNFEQTKAMIEALEKLNTTLSNVNIQNLNGKEDKILNDENNSVSEKVENTTDFNEANVETEVAEKKHYTIGEDNSMSLTYEISHDDIRWALYDLAIDNYDEYGWISKVYDNYFYYRDYEGDKWYRQNYVVTDDVVSFDGERVEVFAEYLTAEERDALATLRTNYDNVVNELSEYKASADKAEKESIMAEEAYSPIADTEAYKEIVSDMDNYSVEQFQAKLDSTLVNYIKETKCFTKKPNTSRKTVSIKFDTDSQNKETYMPYGDLFDH